MSTFCGAILTILGSKLILSFFACAVPFIALGTVCAVFHSGGDKI